MNNSDIQLHTIIMVLWIANNCSDIIHHTAVRTHHTVARTHHTILRTHHTVVRAHHTVVRAHHTVVRAHHTAVRTRRTVVIMAYRYVCCGIFVLGCCCTMSCGLSTDTELFHRVENDIDSPSSTSVSCESLLECTIR